MDLAFGPDLTAGQTHQPLHLAAQLQDPERLHQMNWDVEWTVAQKPDHFE